MDFDVIVLGALDVLEVTDVEKRVEEPLLLDVPIFDVDEIEVDDRICFWKSSNAYPPPQSCFVSPAHAIVHPMDVPPAPPAVFNAFPHQHSSPYCTPA